MSAAEPIDWALAGRAAARIASRHPLPMRRDDGLTAQLPALVDRAVELVGAETGLIASGGSARAVVVDRAEWTTRNVVSFRRLLAPFVDQQRQRFGDTPGPLTRAALASGSKVTALELGALLGWMSARVLGQYELLAAGDDDTDLIYVVGPNIVDLEERYGFDSAQFRLWIAIHEVTHRAQFTAVPWMRQYFLDQLSEVLAFGNHSTAEIAAALRSAATNRKLANERIGEGGMAALLATEPQRLALGRLAALMSLLEGHGEVVMNRAAGAELPAAAEFERVLTDRRRRTNPVQRLIYRLIGFEAKINQYAAGQAFIDAVETSAGRAAIEFCWSGPDALPTLDEIRDPGRWVARTSEQRLVVPAVSTAGAERVG